VIQLLEFASCYVCSPAGQGPVCRRSRLLRGLLKAGDEGFIHKCSLRVSEQTADSLKLSNFFGPDDVFVPVPRCVPNVGRLWPAERLASALVDAGIGCSMWLGLRRARAVHKSATSAAGRRPTVKLHYESFLVEPPAWPIKKIVLIDDVVTKGRTLLAAACRVHDVIPCVQVRAFALIRTLGRIPGVEHLLDPCKGEIRWRNNDACRRP
jgi:hypothetical protein